MASSVAVSVAPAAPVRGRPARRANLVADRHCRIASSFALSPGRPCRVRPARVRFIGTRVPFCCYAHCAMRNPTGSIARTSTGPAIPATVDTVAAPAADRRAAPPAARWRAGSASWRPSPTSGEWGIRDLARATDIPRSAAHRILHDMAALGLLAPADEAGRFRVGADLARIGLLVAEHLDIRREGRPFLERASAAIGETVVIAVYDPVRRQFSAVDAVETSHPIRYIWESLRDWSDLHLGSSGKGILAFLPPDEQAAILDRLPDPVPGRTAPDQGQAARRAGGRPPSAATSSATASATRARSGSRRRSATRAAGSSATSSRRGRTTAPIAAKEVAAGVVVRTAADDLSRRLGWTGRVRPADCRHEGTPAMTDPIRIGIVGAGRIVAAEHVPRFRAIDGVELVGVANRSEESSRRAADELGLPRAYPSWQALVADPELDAVLVGAWPVLHAPVTIAALEAGKHVLTEARMAATAEDARAMVRAARAHPDRDRDVVPATFSAWADAHDRPPAARRRHRARPPRPGRLGLERAGRPGRLLAMAASRRAARTSWPSASWPSR